MPAASTPRITRRGFRNAPAPVRQAAEAKVAEFVEATGATRVLTELRTAAYCGPGSGGDRGAYTLSISGNAGRNCFALHSLEA